jgi:hypothetical protein
MENDKVDCQHSRSLVAPVQVSDKFASPLFSKNDDHNTDKLRIPQSVRRRTWSVNTVMSDDSYMNTRNCADVNLTGSCRNVMQWMEKLCPEDLLPKILSFAGPQSIACVSKVNKHWDFIISKEATWRVVCEELYKVHSNNLDPPYVFLFIFNVF